MNRFLHFFWFCSINWFISNLITAWSLSFSFLISRLFTSKFVMIKSILLKWFPYCLVAMSFLMIYSSNSLNNLFILFEVFPYISKFVLKSPIIKISSFLVLGCLFEQESLQVVWVLVFLFPVDEECIYLLRISLGFRLFQFDLWSNIDDFC